MVELNLAYFRALLAQEIQKLETCCCKWEEICSISCVPEETSGEIRTVIGLAKLLMDQKLKQFAGLIDDSEFKRGEKGVTCLDLQGFWDMVYQEVEKIARRFENLEKCRSNNWEFVKESPVKTVQTKKSNIKIAKPPGKAKPSTKAHILAARMRLAEAKSKFQKKDNFDENVVSIDIVMPQKTNSKSPKTEKRKLQKKENVLPASKDDQNKENFFSVETEQSPKKKPALGTKLYVDDKIMSAIKPASHNIKKKPKELIPLQCVTRSAKRALLAHQNAFKKN